MRSLFSNKDASGNPLREISSLAKTCIFRSSMRARRSLLKTDLALSISGKTKYKRGFSFSELLEFLSILQYHSSIVGYKCITK